MYSCVGACGAVTASVAHLAHQLAWLFGRLVAGVVHYVSLHVARYLLECCCGATLSRSLPTSAALHYVLTNTLAYVCRFIRLLTVGSAKQRSPDSIRSWITMPFGHICLRHRHSLAFAVALTRCSGENHFVHFIWQGDASGVGAAIMHMVGTGSEQKHINTNWKPAGDILYVATTTMYNICKHIETCRAVNCITLIVKMKRLNKNSIFCFKFFLYYFNIHTYTYK